MRWTTTPYCTTLMNVARRSGIGGFALGSAVTLAAVSLFGSVPQAEATQTRRLEREAFHEVIDDVLDRYVDPVNESELLERGLRHMMAGLDAHSHFFSAAQRRDLKARARGGVSGLSVQLKTDTGAESVLEILAVGTGTAAANVGIEAGDHILAVRGLAVAGMISQVEAEALLVGRVGERIELTVQRRAQAQPEDLAIELGASPGKAVEGTLITVDGGHVVFVRIRRFGSGSGEVVKRTLASLRRSVASGTIRGVVLDLRGNPGGEVDEALIVADLFVDEGVLTRTRGRGGRILREEKAHTLGSDTTTPLAVLIDRHSASAAELLTAALQDHGRASVVGERSYGKGTVQQVVGLKDGSVLAMTIARYYSPDDRIIDGVGIKPDTEVIFGARADASSMTAALKELGVRREP